MDEAHFNLFSRKQRAYDAIPSPQASLKEHAKRVFFPDRACMGTINIDGTEITIPNKLGMIEAGKYLDTLMYGVACYS